MSSLTTNIQSYPTNPVDYLNGTALAQSHSSSGGKAEELINELLQLLQQALSALEGQSQSGSGSTPPGSTPSGSTLPGSTPPGSEPITAQDAAATLSSYASQNGIKTITPDTLYSLSQNSSGNTPPAVQQAATFLLQNPNIYNQIETHDQPGADGIAAVGDLQWAANGGLGAEGNSTGVAG
ncbi:MAG TPA: hypothetical protein VNZ04_09810 [Trinickia sp.]|nr:hypothetical protein [Trinickia sp.]